MTTTPTTGSRHMIDETQVRLAAAGSSSPQTIEGSTPMGCLSAGPQTPDPATRAPSPSASAPGRDQTTGSRHGAHETQTGPAAAGSDSPRIMRGSISSDAASAGPQTPDPAILLTTSRDGAPGRDQTTGSRQDLHETHKCGAAAGSDPRNGSAADGVPAPMSSSLADPFLALAADVLDDAERTRIANENRLRHLTRDQADADGEQRGLGLDESHPDVARLAALVEMLAKVEHHATLNLARLMRQHPLGPWIKAQRGVGDKQAARLLAVIGDPYLNMATGEPRMVSQLWSYCGHGDPARRRHKGMTQDEALALGSPTAKMRVWGIAASCLKAQGDYAEVYYARKAATEGREHATACVRCGPSGHPAEPGSPWSDAHRHADALRIVGKTFLRDLWLEAKRLHEEAA